MTGTESGVRCSPLPQRGTTRWLGGNTSALSRVAGILLLAIAAFGVGSEVVPNLGR